MDTGDLFVLAQHEIATAAGIAHQTVTAMPAHAHALSGLPQSDVGTPGVDAPGNLMARHTRILNSRPVPFFYECIAMTNPTGFALDTNLPAAGCGVGRSTTPKFPPGLPITTAFTTNLWLWSAKNERKVCGQSSCDAEGYWQLRSIDGS
jgi:hypothetical protein